MPTIVCARITISATADGHVHIGLTSGDKESSHSILLVGLQSLQKSSKTFISVTEEAVDKRHILCRNHTASFDEIEDQNKQHHHPRSSPAWSKNRLRRYRIAL